jgi:hypothetical protein
MTGKPNPAAAQREAQVLKELRRTALERQQGYRERALKLFPHVCASCGREFEGRRLRELTVHHKDHNWQNNPPDGSNWELLCLFCHDHEHEKYKMAEYRAGGGGAAAPAERGQQASPIVTPFAGLDALLADAGTAPEPAATPDAAANEPDRPPDAPPAAPAPAP